jgi:hypothetical protein
MSEAPSPGRVEPNKSILASHESDGRLSFAVLFTFGPRLTGVDQSEAIEFLLADQISRPCELGRFEAKTISRPSCRTDGCISS